MLILIFFLKWIWNKINKKFGDIYFTTLLQKGTLSYTEINSMTMNYVYGTCVKYKMQQLKYKANKEHSDIIWDVLCQEWLCTRELLTITPWRVVVRLALHPIFSLLQQVHLVLFLYDSCLIYRCSSTYITG